MINFMNIFLSSTPRSPKKTLSFRLSIFYAFPYFCHVICVLRVSYPSLFYRTNNVSLKALIRYLAVSADRARQTRCFSYIFKTQIYSDNNNCIFLNTIKVISYVYNCTCFITSYVFFGYSN
jgi:hypothetical protein